MLVKRFKSLGSTALELLLAETPKASGTEVNEVNGVRETRGSDILGSLFQTVPMSPSMSPTHDGDFGVKELKEAQALCENVLRLRTTTSQKAQDPDLEPRLVRELEDIFTRTSEAASFSMDEVARRAVVLLMKRDLLEVCCEGLSAVFRSVEMNSAAFVLEDLQRYIFSTLEDWQQVLEMQEVRLRSEIDLKHEEKLRADKATNQLLLAAERLQQDSMQLATQNKELKEDLLKMKQMNQALTLEVQRAREESNSKHVDLFSLSTIDSRSRFPDSSRHSLEVIDVDREGSFGDNHTVNAVEPSSSRPTELPRLRPIKTQLSVKGKWSPSKPLTHSQFLNEGNGGKGGKLPSRTLTLKQLKDVISDIYASKGRSDYRLAKAQQPRETMEQHLYLYLTQKFGLRQLILEWKNIIYDGIKQFTEADADVALFGKVLRNEVDEEFRVQQDRLRTKVVETLRTVLQRRHLLLQEPHVEDLVRRHMKGVLQSELWHNIVKVLFKPKDEAAIVASVEEVAARGSPDRQAGDVRFSAFMQVVLRWNMEMHELALKPVFDAFIKVDTLQHGYLTEGEFAAFCRAINPAVSDEEVTLLFATLAPGDVKHVTFSSCAFLLGAELAQLMGLA